MAIKYTKISPQHFQESLLSKTVSEDFSEVVEKSQFLPLFA
jgi:hypothetical protein